MSRSQQWSIENTPPSNSTPRRKRVLTPEQLLTNRLRSKEYYESHKDKVLEKLRNHYAENREKERQRQREKYRRAKAKKLQQAAGLNPKYLLQTIAPSSESTTTPTAAPTTTTPATSEPHDRRLALGFLLN
ncbi:unnamed protein product [Aphanomyces euteiches]|uniref:Uncharacterized protein n=1 Tax=Aphanomyces euteiches TaxID=100861 RepID=A0A6G0X6S0_9STRA|nr:hypothetical protein Ae201684_007978 [Aphanomyces euteiches]KAH9074425.1 hypothetical protein Ae201684P_022232 [Aphanomyces euteiches]KAH9141974.1 hypothetical protein AeRB84_013905 [Aphanomyces euteiches]